jgi:hypothetical protein
MTRAFTVGLFVLGRDDRTRQERPRWVFIETSGRARTLRYWSHAAVRRGRSQSAALRGWALDGGIAVRPWRPNLSITAGYAIGSGDSNRADAVDRTFRQTGLEDTQTRFAGFKRVHSYGELLQPALSNLRVLTLGLGWQGNTVAFDAIAHRYRQAVLYHTAADAALGIRPTGQAAFLGQEVDGVVTVRLPTGLDLTFIAAVYVPGPAQVGPTGRAALLKSELHYFF